MIGFLRIKKFRRVGVFFSSFLIVSIVISSFSLPVLAYEKDGVNFERVKTGKVLDTNETIFNKRNVASEENKNISYDSLTNKKQSLSESKKKLGTNLLRLVDSGFLLPTQNRTQIVSQMKDLKQFIAKGDSVKTIDKRQANQVHNDLVYVYVSLNSTARTSIIDSIAWKVTDRDEKNHLAVALVEVDKLETLASLSGVKSISSVLSPVTRSGSVVTEGDIIHQTDDVRSAYSQSGAGMKIGVISDGVDNIASSKSTGDLPADVTVLDNSIGGDEGTAMLEIIHDMVPDAQLYFHTGFLNSVLFNNAVDDLVAAGVNVIIDDLGFFDQPYFEDGTIASHVASVLAANNIVYVSSAGNSAEEHYQGDYYNDGSDFHDFSRNPSTNDYLHLDIPNNGEVTVILQWNDSFGASGNDYDLLLFNMDGFDLLDFGGDMQSGADDPFEAFSYTNTTGSTITAEIDVKNFNGLASIKTLELFILPSNGTEIVYPNNITPADSIFGHPAVLGVIAVGAIAANDPGNDTIESFSSQGPVTIIGAGQRAKPDISGIDGVAITGAGGFSNPFYGTSAAAPHIAAIVAQLWGKQPSATGEQIRDQLFETAVDLGSNGFDTTFGYGRADALLAFQALPPETHTISGTIQYYDGVKAVPSASVILEDGIGTHIATTTTDMNGLYQFTDVETGGNYVVRATKDDNALGLSGADQGKIGRHIVGLELFDSIYKTIAGDVNNSGGLSGADQGKIGRFIIGLDSNLASGAWKFYSSSAVLDAINYLTVGLTRIFTNLTVDASDQNFIGIKMGDVNNSWNQ